MKVLLTGASGFVGSHILDHLCARRIHTAVLLRPTSNRRFLKPHQSAIQVRIGSLDEPESLRAALTGITHVIHCAGCTKARRVSDYYEVNQVGTRNLIAALNAQSQPLQRFLLISSLAVAGPASPAQPARETDPPRPVSHYGKSKLAAELEVRTHCRSEYVILRPPAVYGPRDAEFSLPMLKAVKAHVLPRPSRRQALSLVFVKDLAAAVLACLNHPAAAGKTYFVASREIITARQMAETIAAHMHRWTLPCPVPAALLWPLCLAGEIRSRLTRQPAMLNLQKFAELRAPGWVCDPSLLEREIGCQCNTTLQNGIAETLAWYSQS